MSKFLYLGISLEDVIRKTTWRPVCDIGRTRELGTLRPGAQADVFAFPRNETFSLRIRT
jgi:predicted amidohydrolase